MFEPETVVVEPDRTTYIELALGPPAEQARARPVRDDDGKPVANARVTAVRRRPAKLVDRAHRRARACSSSRPRGRRVDRRNGKRVGHAPVGRANVPDEQVDIRLDKTSY